MQFATTGAPTDALLVFASTGTLFAVPESTSSVNQPFAVIDRYSGSYLGVVLAPALVSGTATGPLISISSPPGTFTSIWYGGILYSDVVTNGVNYIYMVGNSSGGTPYLQTFGVDTDVDLIVAPQGAGALGVYYAAIANGGGAAPTFGTIGGSGPGTAAQAGWLKIKAGSTGKTYFVPVWST